MLRALHDSYDFEQKYCYIIYIMYMIDICYFICITSDKNDCITHIIYQFFLLNINRSLFVYYSLVNMITTCSQHALNMFNMSATMFATRSQQAFT